MKKLSLTDFRYLIQGLFKNKSILDKISESEEGSFLYNGSAIIPKARALHEFAPVQIKVNSTDFTGTTITLLNQTTGVAYNHENFSLECLFECHDVGEYKLFYGDLMKTINVEYFGQYQIDISETYYLFKRNVGSIVPFSIKKQGNRNIEISSSYLYSQALSPSSQFLGFIHTYSKFDLTSYNKINFEVSITKAGGTVYPFAVGYSSTIVASTDTGSFTSFLNAATTIKTISTVTGIITYTIDISDIVGLYYIYSYSGSSTAYIYDIYLT